MPRSREIDKEMDRARSTEMGSTRSSAKTGVGPKMREKKGFGSEKGMQQNQKGHPKNEF